MRILYDQKTTKEDRHTFQINQGGPLRLNTRSCGPTVTIVFRDGKLVSVDWPRGDVVETRSLWRVLGAIAAKVDELESTLYGVEAQKP